MPTHSAMHLAALLALPLFALVGCSESQPQQGGDALGLGEASVAVMLDADGCTAAAIDFESTTGRPLRLPQGCLDFRDGTVVRDLTLRLRPQPATVVPLGQRGLQSAHRVELLGPGGQPVQASFRSPFEITLGDPERLGAWFTTGFVDGNEWSQDDVDGADPVILDAVAWNLNPQGRLLVRQTGVFGITYEPLTEVTPSLKGGGGGFVTQTAQLDGDDSTELAVFSLINQQTAQWVFGGIFYAPVDTTFAVTSSAGTLLASYESTGDGGTRLVLESQFGNLWRLEAGQRRISDGVEVATETIMVGGSSEEESPNDLYAGSVKTELRISAPATFWLSAAADFQLLFSPPERAVIRWLEDEGETTVGGVDILRLQASVPRILDRLPEDWFGSGGDRTMNVAAPAPVEVNVSVSGDGDGTGNVSSSDPMFPIACEVPPLTCTDTFLVNDDGEIFLEASAASDSVFAGWSGCPETLLDQCRLSWTQDEDVASFNVTARFELTDDDPCHSAYGLNAGYLPCEGAGPGQCKFYTVLDQIRSCVDACQAGGGTCIQALSDVADGCSGTEPRACDDPANDRICFCTRP